MNLANKSFKNNKTGDIIKVIDAFENIAILENKQKIDSRTLLDPNQYTEQIDPNNFFSNQGAYNILAEKIKNISTANMKDDDGPTQVINVNLDGKNIMPSTNESAIVLSSEEDERAELARKYGAINTNVDAVSKQNQAFAKLLGEEEIQQTPQQEIQKFEVRREQPIEQSIHQQMVTNVSVDDPIITMFRKTKRGVDFSLSIDITDKIPRIDFIEMMEDSYEISIIDFLADEFTNKILQDPNIIKNKIKDKIKEVVYGKSKVDVNSQITDSVTQKYDPLTIEKEPVLTKDLPKKVTRKPKPNTAIGEKPGYKSPRKKETPKND